MVCPLISYQKEYCYEIQCIGEECMLSSPTGCLIADALQTYIKTNEMIKTYNPADDNMWI